MTSWPKNPIIYEINLWVWLQELSARHRQPLTLATIPGEELDAIAAPPGSPLLLTLTISMFPV